MDSWWDLGEWSGYSGTELADYHISCAFCGQEGNFEIENHVHKEKPNGRKRLNFDTLKCGNCANYIMVFWSAGDQLHDFKTLPWSLRRTRWPESWPDDVGNYWLQAKRSLGDENWDAAVLTARSALQLALRHNNAKGNNLKKEIQSLSDSGILPPTMKEWSEEIRALGNDSAHPEPGAEAINPEDAKDVVEFLDYLMDYLYTLPHRIDQYRSRKTD